MLRKPSLDEAGPSISPVIRCRLLQCIRRYRTKRYRRQITMQSWIRHAGAFGRIWSRLYLKTLLSEMKLFMLVDFHFSQYFKLYSIINCSMHVIHLYNVIVYILYKVTNLCVQTNTEIQFCFFLLIILSNPVIN